MAENVKITLVKSVIGCSDRQQKVVRGLGLRKTQSSVVRAATPEVLGMINKVSHLLQVEKAQ